MTQLRSRLSILAIAIALTGCGNMPASPLSAVAARLMPTGGQAVIIPAGTVSSDRRPHLAATLPSRNGAATLSLQASRDGFETWQASDGIQVILHEGLVVGTRGLGPDLLSANVAEEIAALKGQGGSARHDITYLNGENRLKMIYANCIFSEGKAEALGLVGAPQAGTKWTEHCSGSDGQDWTNLYWVGQGGRIWKSQQWLRPELGFLLLARTPG